MRLLSEAIASLPVHVYENSEDGSRELAREHPLYTLLHDSPNAETTSFTFLETAMAHLLLYGNAYAQIVRNGRGTPTSLWLLSPDRMSVDRDSSGRLVYAYTRERFEDGTYGAIKLRREQILHIPGLGFDGLVGYSPIAMAKSVISSALATEDYGASKPCGFGAF